MAREAAPTRWPARHGPRRHAANPRVDAGVKELNEMTIGRTEDPENPSLAPAFVAASLFGAGPRNPSGPADMGAASTGRTHARNRPPVTLIFLLHSRGRPHMRVPHRPAFASGFCVMAGLVPAISRGTLPPLMIAA